VGDRKKTYRRTLGLLVRNYLLVGARLHLSHFGLSWLHVRESGRADLIAANGGGCQR